MPDVERARALIAAAAGRAALTEDAAKDVLACFGLSVPRRVIVPCGTAVGDALATLRPPFVLKVVAASILHKSDVGGVQVGLVDAAAAQAAVDDMAARLSDQAIEGWLLEEMAPRGIEMVIGGGVDPRFGPHVMLGLGGVTVELLEDVRFGICPLRPSDVRQMLDRLRAVRLLRGWRGTVPADEEAVVDAVMRVGGPDGLLMELEDQVAELDINPLIVGTVGAVAVDARIVLQAHQ